MKTHNSNITHWFILPIILVLTTAVSAPAQSTAFTYQGRLTDTGGPANGHYDLTFGLYAASSGGSPVGGIQTNAGLAITNGFFTASLNFGNVFNGTQYWVELAARTNGSSSGFVTLAPRQLVTPTPYALQALTASNTTGAIADSQLSANVALLSGGANFAGTVSAAQFTGNGAGLSNLTVTSTVTNVVAETNMSGTAVLRINNGSDFSSLPATRQNLGGIKVLSGYNTWEENFSNNPPDYPGQIAIADNGSSWPELAEAFTDVGHLDPFLGQWCGSFRYPGIAQWGDPEFMATNFLGSVYKMTINGTPNQPVVTAATDVLVLENEQTNSRSAILFNFAQSNNILQESYGMELGAGNGGSGTYEVAATSNAAFIATGGSCPLNFLMHQRNTSGSYPQFLAAYFDGPTTDFHYIANNGNNGLWLQAASGSVETDGSLTVKSQAFLGPSADIALIGSDQVYIGTGSGTGNTGNISCGNLKINNRASIAQAPVSFGGNSGLGVDTTGNLWLGQYPNNLVWLNHDGSYVGLGTNTYVSNNLTAYGTLDMESTTSAFLPPRMTKAQRNAIPSPAPGSVVYQTDAGNNGLRYYDGTNWNKMVTATD
jgi:hypothetical protein